MMQVREDVELRELADTEARYASFDHSMPAVALEATLHMVFARYRRLLEMPCGTGADDAFMSGEFANRLGVASLRQIAGSRAGKELASRNLGADQSGNGL